MRSYSTGSSGMSLGLRKILLRNTNLESPPPKAAEYEGFLLRVVYGVIFIEDL